MLSTRSIYLLIILNSGFEFKVYFVGFISSSNSANHKYYISGLVNTMNSTPLCSNHKTSYEFKFPFMEIKKEKKKRTSDIGVKILLSSILFHYLTKRTA